MDSPTGKKQMDRHAQIMCEVCGKEMKSDKIKRHMQQHEGHDCLLCKKKFPNEVKKDTFCPLILAPIPSDVRILVFESPRSNCWKFESARSMFLGRFGSPPGPRGGSPGGSTPGDPPGPQSPGWGLGVGSQCPQVNVRDVLAWKLYTWYRRWHHGHRHAKSRNHSWGGDFSGVGSLVDVRSISPHLFHGGGKILSQRISFN